MDSPKSLHNQLRTSLTLILIFSLTFFPSISEGSAPIEDSKGLKQKELVLGSRPPRCVNKCLNCRPCVATLVVSPHQRNGHKALSAQRDESYYLLSWKCKCDSKRGRKEHPGTIRDVLSRATGRTQQAVVYRGDKFANVAKISVS